MAVCAGSGGGSQLCRWATKQSYRDTRTSFSLGRKKRGHSAQLTAAEKVRLEHLKRLAPKIRRRQAHSRISFSQDLVAPLVIGLIVFAVVVAAITALPVNGLLVVVSIVAGAGAFIAGNKVANSMSRKRKNSPCREEV